MRKLLKTLLAAVLVGAMLFALCMPSHAIKANECGTYLTKNPSYNKDGKFYMSFDIQAGRPPNTSAGYTSLVNAKLLNPSGQQILSWGQVEVSPGARKTINYATSYSGRPAGTYTIAVTVTSRGKEYNTGKTISWDFTWRYTINHGTSSSNSSNNNSTAVTPTINYHSKELVHYGGTYVNKITFSYSNAKGKRVNMAIYDSSGRKMNGYLGDQLFSSNGTYSFIWSGYNSNNGYRCVSDYYTIEYYLSGGNTKSVKLYLQVPGRG